MQNSFGAIYSLNYITIKSLILIFYLRRYLDTFLELWPFWIICLDLIFLRKLEDFKTVNFVILGIINWWVWILIVWTSVASIWDNKIFSWNINFSLDFALPKDSEVICLLRRNLTILRVTACVSCAVLYKHGCCHICLTIWLLLLLLFFYT